MSVSTGTSRKGEVKYVDTMELSEISTKLGSGVAIAAGLSLKPGGNIIGLSEAMLRVHRTSILFYITLWINIKNYCYQTTASPTTSLSTARYCVLKNRLLFASRRSSSVIPSTSISSSPTPRTRSSHTRFISISASR